jgi:hypothetical protein
MGHRLIPDRQALAGPRPLTAERCLSVVSSSIAPSFDGLSSCPGYIIYALLTLSPRYSRSCPRFGVQLAWVSHAASVRSEPGSNPSLDFRSNRPRRAGSSSRMILTGRAVPDRRFPQDKLEGAKTQNPVTFFGNVHHEDFELDGSRKKPAHNLWIIPHTTNP